MPRVYPLSACFPDHEAWEPKHVLMTWTAPEERNVGFLVTSQEKPPTEADEIAEAVKEWYTGRGQVIPESDQEFLAVYRAQELKEFDRWDKILKGESNEPPPPPPKPVYGTPEFWKAYWEKKRANGLVATSRPAPVEKKKKSLKTPK